MSFPRYDEYKDSGVEWLGEVPAHWAVIPLKYVVTLRSGGTPSKDRLDYWDGAIPWASAKDMKVEVINDTVDHLTDVAIEEGAASLLPTRSVLVVVRGMILARTFPVALTGAPMAFNQDLKALLPNRPLLAEHLAWYLRGTANQSLLRLDEAGHGTKALRMEAWTSMEVTLPSQAEQEQISAFLDRETGKIDDLVAEQQNLIALLKEKRQALISHAVTKGLNPNAPMKDSGVEWLGEVPAHWEVMPIRYAAKLESGHTPSRSRPEYWEDCSIPWFTLADVWQIREGADYIYETKELVSELGLANSSARLLPADTVMVSRTASVGFSAIMGVPMATTQDFANWVCGPTLLPKFLLHVFRSMASEFERLKMGSTHNTIYMPDIAAFRFTLPPLEEQTSIAAFLDSETAKIDDLMAESESTITFLQERRTALISAAVTGKIDVRAQAA